MKPLLILLLSTACALILYRLAGGMYDIPFSARIGMSAMLLFTAMGHFMFPKGMAMMIPAFIPFKLGLVYVTAGIEILGAIGLHLPEWRLVTGWMLITFFVLILPANIKAAMERLDFQKATYNGNGPSYLWFRIPLQLFFIAWVYLSAVIC